ncbi:hypothetical protein ETB97_010551 [Aspergillus alliaceus]|uniref:Uncharacterized protein n=1 Tax=Petromyces alliaceus TaxID=209559 RepID=A0A8H6E170_PETAA|nr:hypothetical protein ETB97_010551 [Aspergillus burnettii]
MEDRLSTVAHARTLANERLWVHAIKQKQVRDEKVKLHSFKKGDWVLVRNEDPQKLQSKWFGPYKVMKTHVLGTYVLEEPGGRILHNLINGRRLIAARVTDPQQLWTSASLNRRLKKAGMAIKKPVEVRQVIDGVEPTPPSYNDLSMMTREEWERSERSGDRLARRRGREDAMKDRQQAMADRVVRRRVGRARKKGLMGAGRPGRPRKRSVSLASSSDDNASVAEDRDSDEEEDIQSFEGSIAGDEEEVQPLRDANAVTFEGSIAVVPPTLQEIRERDALRRSARHTGKPRNRA